METWLETSIDILVQELTAGFTNPEDFVRSVVRLMIALVLGGILGWERGRVGKAAGLRTHMLVAMGAAVAILIPHLADMNSEALSRVVAGVLTGIGFIGGGTILKLSDKRQVKGLTTAANLWMTAAIGIAVGSGRLGLGVLATVLSLVVLSVLGRLEHRFMPSSESEEP